MVSHTSLRGVYAAALTPLHTDYSLAVDDVAKMLGFLERRGCHGALLFGTTGEGPSFSPAERIPFLRKAVAARQAFPEFRLLAGTGTPSLHETIDLTRSAFDSGVDGVVVLPPYYYRKVNDEGLFAWFSQVLRRGVPPGGALFLYHIPNITGIELSLDLIARLKDAFPERLAGIKDSTGNPELAVQLGERFGQDMMVMTGNDRLFSHALAHQASGCITALANLYSPILRTIWDAHLQGTSTGEVQERLNALRAVMDRYAPAPPLIKAMLANRRHLPRWPVRPPLTPLPRELEKEAAAAFAAAEQD